MCGATESAALAGPRLGEHGREQLLVDLGCLVHELVFATQNDEWCVARTRRRTHRTFGRTRGEQLDIERDPVRESGHLRHRLFSRVGQGHGFGIATAIRVEPIPAEQRGQRVCRVPTPIRAQGPGHGRIDAVLNNAALASMNHILLTPASTANRIMEINFTGTMLVCRDAAKVMIKRRFGRIVNFSSVVSPLALAGEAVYAASKSAVVTFTRILAFELGQWGITCNAFGATPIMTDMIKGVHKEKIDALVNSLAIKRMGTPQDCANACDFFLSAASDNITGQVIYLGGVS